jgi:APA family basic amino acid/polyamine antiporter
LIRGLSLSATTSLVVGTIIGSGIFIKTARMAQVVGTPSLVLLAWVAAGLLSLAGALSYAELGAMLPAAGGEYVYLRAAYGDLPAFLFGWMRFIVGSTGSLASIAAGFAIFLAALIPLDKVWMQRSFDFLGQHIDWQLGEQQIVAVAILLLLTAVNCLKVVFGGWVQIIFSTAKVLAIIAIMLGAFFFAPTASWEHLRSPAGAAAWSGWSAFGAAMLAALWAYDGWNNMPMAAGEVRDPGRNVPRGLMFGMAIVLTVYVLVNVAYCYSLPFSEIVSSSSTLHGSALPVAAKAAQTFLPRFGVAFLALAGVLSTVGTLNGSILTGARIPFAMARDGLFFSRFADLSEKTAVPVPSIIFQGIWGSVLVLSASFDQLTDCVVFAGMIFYATTTFAVFVLRRKMPDANRPYKTLGYPIVPIIYILVALWLLVNTLRTSTVESVAGLVLIGLGLPVFYWQRKARRVVPMLILFFTVMSLHAGNKAFQYSEGGIIRGPLAKKEIALEFTADEFTDGAPAILDQLAARNIQASFFLTGRCVRNPTNEALVRRIVDEGHYLGPHSDTHPLLCPWAGPKKTLVTKEFFQGQMETNIEVLEKFGVRREGILYFIPPYEHYNEEIVQWAKQIHLQLINFSPGTRSTADYIEDGSSNFISSEAIIDSIETKEKKDGLNGYLLLLHFGVSPHRTDKMADHLGELLDYLQGRGYEFVRVDELLGTGGLTNGMPCPFDTNKMEFAGTPVEQARFLLRPVRRGGDLGRPLKKLPEPLENLIGQPVKITREALRAYLEKHGIAESDLGGPITNKLRAKYFIIHDTSTPNYRTNAFPSDINQTSWRLNNLDIWKKHPAAHIFVSRTGQSKTFHEFVVPWRATKFESKVLTTNQSRGLFIHIENTLPRRSDPARHPGNDAIAPQPGFTEPMLDRLALLYLTASLEHGQWMVPAFHATIDAGLYDAHDDPQNFDLTEWAKRLGVLIEQIRQGETPSSPG